MTNVVTFDARDGRPEPPAELSADEAKEWRRLMECMPRDWLRPELFSTLIAYCRHVEQGNFLARAMRDADALDSREVIDRYIPLARAHGRATLAMLRCGRKLGLYAAAEAK
jgi:phage terminase small subunit